MYISSLACKVCNYVLHENLNPIPHIKVLLVEIFLHDYRLYIFNTNWVLVYKNMCCFSFNKGTFICTLLCETSFYGLWANLANGCVKIHIGSLIKL